MAFSENNVLAFEELQAIFPNAIFNQKVNKFQQDALFIFRNDWTNLNEIKLHLKGTKFQLKVWEALLSIPYGNLSTNGEIAEAIQHPKDSRAVGTAIGNNPKTFTLTELPLPLLLALSQRVFKIFLFWLISERSPFTVMRM